MEGLAQDARQYRLAHFDRLCEGPIRSTQALSPPFWLALNGAHSPATHTEEKEPLAPNPNDRCADETHRLAATLTFHAWIDVRLDGGGL
jgi:hypothetical protein